MKREQDGTATTGLRLDAAYRLGIGNKASRRSEQQVLRIGRIDVIGIDSQGSNLRRRGTLSAGCPILVNEITISQDPGILVLGVGWRPTGYQDTEACTFYRRHERLPTDRLGGGGIGYDEPDHGDFCQGKGLVLRWFGSSSASEGREGCGRQHKL